ncbi:MAG TPA: sulfatase-like hydrolase/transferase [Bryobacteraceae bacterium]|nr:sulfatase-like hydrolase/transferase [Bryobacteraceae bacterium]
MNRRDFLRTAAAAFAAQPTRAQRISRLPNFVIVLLDDLGCTDLGCFGAKDLATPNIDGLAASGARFTNWYSNAPLCAPSRASLMTGRYPLRAGVPNNGARLAPDQQTIASVLKSRGYATGLIGKWHLGVPGDAAPNDRGFDYFYGFHSGCVDFYSHRYYWGEPKTVNYHDLWRNRTEIFEDGQYLTERITQEAVQFIRRNRERPFFLYAAYNAPHYPMHAPQRYMDRFSGLAPERRTYAAMISAIDDGVGTIVDTLNRDGLLENTCVFFLADNGATTEPRAGLLGQPATAGVNRPYRGYKFSLFDGGMHVPAIVSWPGVIPKGRTVSAVAMTMDILPTVCKAAAAGVPQGYMIDGRDVLPLATAGATSAHDAIFWAQGKQMAVRRGRWKLVVNGFTADGTPAGRTPLEGDDALFLSDLEADPGESHNLRRLHPQLVDELATLIHNWHAAVQPRP